MYVVCKVHVEDAIEEFLDLFEAPPDVYQLGDIVCTEWTAPSVCHYCPAAPEFLVV